MFFGPSARLSLRCALGSATSLMLAALPLAAQNDNAGQIGALVDKQAPAITRNALKIWDYAELGYHETQSAALLQAELQAAGFTVKAGVAGSRTKSPACRITGASPSTARMQHPSVTAQKPGWPNSA